MWFHIFVLIKKSRPVERCNTESEKSPLTQNQVFGHLASAFQRCMKSCQCVLLLPAAQTGQTPSYRCNVGTHVKSSCDVALQQVNLLHCIVTWAAPCVRSQSTNCYCLNRKYSSASPGESHQLLSLAFRKWAWQRWRPLIERASWKIIGKRVPSYHFSLIFPYFRCASTMWSWMGKVEVYHTIMRI